MIRSRVWEKERLQNRVEYRTRSERAQYYEYPDEHAVELHAAKRHHRLISVVERQKGEKPRWK